MPHPNAYTISPIVCLMYVTQSTLEPTAQSAAASASAMSAAVPAIRGDHTIIQHAPLPAPAQQQQPHRVVRLALVGLGAVNTGLCDLLRTHTDGRLQVRVWRHCFIFMQMYTYIHTYIHTYIYIHIYINIQYMLIMCIVVLEYAGIAEIGVGIV
jgi:hypothetical protein